MDTKHTYSRADAALDTGHLDDSLGFLLRLAQVRAFGVFFDVMTGSGAKPGEYTVMTVIKLNPGLRQGTIARQLHIKPAHMAKLAKRLETAGLVERLVSNDDRRALRLYLTPKGETHITQSSAKMRHLIEVEREPLDHAEFTQLTALLKKYTGFGEAPK